MSHVLDVKPMKKVLKPEWEFFLKMACKIKRPARFLEPWSKSQWDLLVTFVSTRQRETRLYLAEKACPLSLTHHCCDIPE